jgi:hypothetical protein
MRVALIGWHRRFISSLLQHDHAFISSQAFRKQPPLRCSLAVGFVDLAMTFHGAA